MIPRLFGFWMAAFAITLLGTGAGAGEKFVLKFKKGSKSIYRMRTETEQTQEIMGNSMDSTINTEQVLVLTVDDVKDNGTATITVKIHEARFEATIPPLGDYTFDPKSDDNDQSSMLGSAITPIFELLNGAEFTIEVKPTGKVVSASGYGEMLEDILGQNPLSSQFVAGGSNQAIVSEIQELFVEYSDKSVESGGTWTVKAEDKLPAFGTFKSESTMTFQGAEQVKGKDALRIETSSNLEISLDLDQEGAQVSGTLSGSGAQAEALVDPKTGFVIHSKGEGSFSGTINVDAGGMLIPIESNQTRRTTVERLEKLP